MTEEQLVANAAMATIVAATATVTYAALTLLLYFEARASRNVRREANLAVFPAPDRGVGLYLEVHAQNFGPGIARDVVIEYWLADSAGNPLEASRARHAEPVWGPGQSRRFMPRKDLDGQITGLQQMADEDLRLHLGWSWRDPNRSLVDTARRQLGQHSHTTVHALKPYTTDLYGGHALIETDPLKALPNIKDELVKIERGLKEIAKAAGQRQQ